VKRTTHDYRPDTRVDAVHEIIRATRREWQERVAELRAAFRDFDSWRQSWRQEAFVFFRTGDCCGTCGAPLVITKPDKAKCPRCGPDAIPF